MDAGVKKKINRLVTIVVFTLLALALLFVILYTVFNNGGFLMASIIIVSSTFLIAVFHNTVNSAAYKKPLLLIAIIICVASVLTCLWFSFVSFNKSELIREEITVLKEERSEYDFFSEEWLQIDNEIDSKYKLSYEYGKPARLLLIAALGINVVLGFLTNKKNGKNNELDLDCGT